MKTKKREEEEEERKDPGSRVVEVHRKKGNYQGYST